MVARAYPSFALRGVGQALLAAGAWSTVLAILSLAAWSSSGLDSLVRIVRLMLAMWLAGAVLYPGLASDFLPLRRWPWWVGVSFVALLWVACCLPRRMRPVIREVVFTAASLPAFYYTPLPTAGLSNLHALAGREFTEQDVILLGFDSISYRDVAPFLAEFVPSRGTKIVYTNASTPVTLTGGAWRSLLSGLMPRPDDVLPGSIWPRDRRLWLPAQLARRGYRPTFLQDDPTTNVYRTDECVRVSQPQGWQHAFIEFAWNIGFPLSTAGGRWWVGALGGPAMEPRQDAYCARCFIDLALREMAIEAREGPVFWAVHTCYVHEPARLNLAEVGRISGWWKWAPNQLDGSHEVGEVASEEFAAARMESFHGLLRETLDALDRKGILGRATVFVLSDHGPRRKGVPTQISQHVMLAAFLPGERRDVFVDDPVSLVDLAPTARVRLGLETPPTDGVPLPVGGEHRLDRPPNRISPRENPLLRLDFSGLGLAQFRDLLTLRPDGTFTIDGALLARLIASKHAALPPRAQETRSVLQPPPTLSPSGGLPPGGGGAPSLSQTSEALGAKLHHGDLIGGVAVTPEELADLGREPP
jgi:hypothetical protein